MCPYLRSSVHRVTSQTKRVTGRQMDFDPQPGTRRHRRKTLLVQQPGQESRKRKTVISFLQAGNQRKRGNQTMTFVAEGTREQSG